MQKRRPPVIVFSIFLFVSILIFFLSITGKAVFLESFINSILSPSKTVYQNTRLYAKQNALQEENQRLTKLLLDRQKLLDDNKALRDQFQTQYPKSQNLLPAQIVGSEQFIPNVSHPQIFIVSIGEKNNVTKGMAVVYKDNLIGKIVDVSGSFAKVQLVTDRQFLVTAKAEDANALNKILGVASGQGENLLLDNVVLSEKLEPLDIVTTYGDINGKGEGIPPDLIIGKIVSIEKKPSALFQKAIVESLVDFSDLSVVFIVINK